MCQWRETVMTWRSLGCLLELVITKGGGSQRETPDFLQEVRTTVWFESVKRTDWKIKYLPYTKKKKRVRSIKENKRLRVSIVICYKRLQLKCILQIVSLWFEFWVLLHQCLISISSLYGVWPTPDLPAFITNSVVSIPIPCPTQPAASVYLILL